MKTGAAYALTTVCLLAVVEIARAQTYTNTLIWGADPPHESYTYPSSWLYPQTTTTTPTTILTTTATTTPITATITQRPSLSLHSGPYMSWWGDYPPNATLLAGSASGSSNGGWAALTSAETEAATIGCPGTSWSGWWTGAWSTAPAWTAWTGCVASTTMTKMVTTTEEGDGGLVVTYTSFGVKVEEASATAVVAVSTTTTASSTSTTAAVAATTTVSTSTTVSGTSTSDISTTTVASTFASASASASAATTTAETSSANGSSAHALVAILVAVVGAGVGGASFL